MIRNVIFDMGNVLMDYTPMVYAERHTSNEADALLLYNRIFLSIEWIKMDKGQISQDEMVERCQAEVPERLHPQAENLIKSWHNKIETSSQMYDLVNELNANGYNTYLLSNTSKQYHDFKGRIPAISLLDGEIISADEQVIKPFPEIYKILTSRFDLKAEECFFIDDAPVNIFAALEQGWSGFVFTNNVAELRLALVQKGIKINR